MNDVDKKSIHKAFVEAIDKEDLHTRQAAAFLNLNPLYVTYMKSPKYYTGVSAEAMKRFEEWFNSRAPIASFQIPEDEEMFSSGDIAPKPRKKKEPVFVNDDIAGPVYGSGTEKPGKSVKLVLYQAEIESLNKRIDLLVKDNNDKAVALDNMSTNLCLVLDEVKKLEERIRFVEHDVVSSLRQEIEDLKTGMGHLVTLPKPEGKAQIVFFQRNTYKS